jgi:tRNA1Val (adenine37-N6)-methyltransferase
VPGNVSATDTLFGGRVVLHQPARGGGYRVNVDALILAAFAAARGRARFAADLGAGVGAVALGLLHLGGATRVLLVERDRAAADLARANLVANGWHDRGEVVCEDVAAAARAHRGTADLCVCNPPYVRPGRGRTPAPARAHARSGALGPFTAAARTLCGRRARACFVYPAHELAALFAELRAAGLEPKRLRLVHAAAGRDARIALVEAQPGKAGGLRLEPPLVERDAGGLSREMRALVGG